LLNNAKIWDTLKDYVTKEKGKRDHIINLILYCLDYGKEGNSRDFLQFCLEKGSINIQKSALELLRILNRSEFIGMIILLNL
jgi:rapamycin-insensitive companion of mTOR